MCNCRKKASCPLDGNCQKSKLIYQCTVKKSENDEGVQYIGLTENTFKTRWYQHKHTFRHEDKSNSTELSKYVWSLQNKNIEPILKWKVIEHAQPYKNGSKLCDL
uniref:GIY-YIG domain-containing protein n=1 Tax=Clytia hemisphaerica TaxID=252671 RepID=A0A7M5U8X3_9CNID